MKLEELRAAVDAGEIDTVVVSFTDHYGRSMGKRFDAEFFLDEAVDHGTHGCDYLLTVDMEMEPVPGYRYASWQQGYGDFHLVPDMSTLTLAGWTTRTAFVLCDVLKHRRRRANERVRRTPIDSPPPGRASDGGRSTGNGCFGAGVLLVRRQLSPG